MITEQSIRNSRQSKHFIQHLLQKATGKTAVEVREMLANPNIYYKINSQFIILNNEIIEVKSELLD